MASLEVLQTRLAEAQAAYHAWRTGSYARTYQDSNGERVEYSAEGLRGLPGYIADLERQIALLLGCATTGGPLRVFF